MERSIVLLTALAILAGCASSDPWTRDDTAWETIYAVSALADGYMTAKIQDHPNIIENGPIASRVLGRNPATSDTWMYFGSLIVSHYLISRMLPKDWRTAWQVFGIVKHGLAVNKGNQVGLFAEPCTTPVPAEFSCAPLTEAR